MPAPLPTGLTSAQAQARIGLDGPNTVAEPIRHPVARAVAKFWAPVPWMLESTIVMQIGLGEYPEAAAIALSDPPRADSAGLIARLGALGVRTVMVTGDAAITARVVADAVGITGPSCLAKAIPHDASVQNFAVFAGVLPEDKFALSSATDNVRPSASPNVWRIGNLTLVAVALGFCDLAFCTGSLAVGHFALHLGHAALQSLTVITMVYSSQAIFYVSRERQRLWCSRPGALLLVGSGLELGIFSTLSHEGILMQPLPLVVLFRVFAGAVVLALVLDSVKVALTRRLPIA